MRNPWLLLAPAAVVLLLVADRTAGHAMGGHDHDHDHGYESVETSTMDQRRIRLLPTLRAFLVQVWLIRIDSAIRTGRFHLALRHARQALAIAPDLPAVRIRLADILAYDLPPQEPDPARRLAWIGEGLAVLDAGLERDPFDARLHANRGHLLRTRGERFPEFEAAFRAVKGESTLEAGVDAFVRGADRARGDTMPMWWAVIGLETRGDDRLARARAGASDLFAGARADYAKEAELLRELLAQSRLAKEILTHDLDYAESSVELADLLAAGLADADARVRELENVRDAVVEVRRQR